MTRALFQAPAQAEASSHHAPRMEAARPGPRRLEATASLETPSENGWPSREGLVRAYESVRRFTHTLAGPLAVEDYCIQTMECVSPAKWHLAHSSWFYERFILHERGPGYEPWSEPYYYLFNSYYNGAGPQHCRASRGLISRPTVDEVYQYRRAIDQRMIDLLLDAEADELDWLRPRVVLGLHHEQQHQELMLTDLKHVFSSNPLLPSYARESDEASPRHRDAGREDPRPGRDADDGDFSSPSSLPPSVASSRDRGDWLQFDEGLYEIGHPGPAWDLPFAYDNETPRHKAYLRPFALAPRPVINAEVQAFIADGGYERAQWWLSEGWSTIQQHDWRMPIYWYRDPERDHAWMQFTLRGPEPVNPTEPACHLSYFEADAIARWMGGRLPTEAEWEVACRDEPVRGNLVESLRFHPEPIRAEELGCNGDARPTRCFGDVWEWCASQYLPYPGYQPLTGTLGEYNGKFMCNQFVLRGGSCATGADHIRPTYRNFFPPDARWQFTGARLAKDGEV